MLSASSGTGNGRINTLGASHGFGLLPLRLLVSIHTSSNTFLQKILCRFSIQAKISGSAMWWSPDVKGSTVRFSPFLQFCLLFLSPRCLRSLQCYLLRTLAHLEHVVHQAGIFPRHAYSKSDALQISYFCPLNVGEGTPVGSRSTFPSPRLRVFFNFENDTHP